jgi:hypothetical protein
MNLNDAIGKSVFIFDDRSYTDEDLKAMTTEELERLRMRVSLSASNLSNAIRAKQIDYTNGGKGMTMDWYVSHKNSLTIQQRMLPYISFILRKRYSLVQGISDFFMKEAKGVLAQDDYEKILSRAKQEMDVAKKEVCP